MITNLQAIADQMTERGYVVFPARDKVPLVAGWQRLRASVPVDGGNGYGVKCGAGLLVVDADGPEGIANLIRLFEARGSRLPQRTVTTGGGGAHYYFRVPDGQTCPGNSQSRLAPKVDTRGRGGQVIGGGSSHPSGSCYVWANGLPAPIGDLPVAPDWLLDQLDRGATRPRGAPRGAKGTGRDVAYRVSGPDRRSAAGGALALWLATQPKLPSIRETRDWLRSFSDQHCVPPLAIDDLDTLAADTRSRRLQMLEAVS